MAALNLDILGFYSYNLYMRKWTEEEKQKQRDAIKKWKPWEKSTGPTTAEGKDKVSRNSYTHGFRSRDIKALRQVLRLQKQFLRALLKTLPHPPDF